MSQENVEVVRAVWDYWIRGDLPGLVAQYDPTVVWDLSHYRDWPEPNYEGREGVRRFFDEWLAVWDDYEAGFDEMRLASDGRVLVLAWQRGNGHGSGLSMDMRWAQIFTVREGQITRIENYDDPAETLEAVGLRE
jgi:uncharacterized protein